MARLRSAPVAASPPPKLQSKRPALKEKTNTARARAAHAEEGDIEGLIKDSKKPRGRPRRSAHKDEDLVMAGGLGQKEAEVPRSDLGATMTDELAKSDAPAPPTSKPNKRPPRMMRKPIQNEAQSKVLDGLKKRMAETARKEAGNKGVPVPTKRVSTGTAPSSDILTMAPVTVRKPAVPAHDLSEYDIQDSPPPPGKRSSLAQQTSSLKPHSTPAMDTSVLKNFKRRARQPSMLAMVQQRTMSARPSLANKTAAEEEDPSIYDFDAGDLDDEGDFAPEAEGTPQHMSKAKRRSGGSSGKKPVAKDARAKPAPASKKRKSGEADVSSGALETLRAKRHQSEAPAPSDDDLADEVVVPESQPVERRSSTETARQPTPMPHDTSDIQVINSSQSTPPPVESVSPEARRGSFAADLAVPSTEEYQDEAQPGLDHGPADDSRYDPPNGTMAEPASSSPAPDDIMSGTQADPVTQVSPPPVKEIPKKASKAKPVSTATLQTLLPKRRQPLKPRHRKSEYDFVSESEGEGDVEMARGDEDDGEIAGRRRRQTKVTPAKGRRKTAAATVKAAKGKATQQVRKSSAAPPGKKPVRTYARAAAAVTSDKENADDDDLDVPDDENDSTDLLPEKIGTKPTSRSAELEEVRRKFAEVDEWDMEFESLGDEEHRSSSQQWR